jgi:hypothetical protein
MDHDGIAGESFPDWLDIMTEQMVDYNVIGRGSF